MDAYDLAKQILELYSKNVNKSSGEITKHDLSIPLVYENCSEVWVQLSKIRVDHDYNGKPVFVMT